MQNKEQLFAEHSQCVLGAVANERRIFIDRGSNILLVAHLDTVLPPKLVRPRRTKSGKIKRIYAHGLDDRLGCTIAAVLSERLNVDLLLTDNEEKCQSTARYHELKDYNWVAEFDREGQDVVTYDIDSIEFRSALSKFWDLGIGSYSDLCSMQTTACCVNVGIGHKFSHSRDSYVCIKTLRKQIRKFLLFYGLYKDTKFEREYNTSIMDENLFNLCDVCEQEYGETIYGYCLCYNCLMEVFGGILC